MTVPARTAAIVAGLALWAAAVHGQEAEAGAHPMSCSLYTGLSYAYDSNIDHTTPGLDIFGGFAGLGAHCRLGSASRGTLAMEYDGVFRQYARTTVWNVPGHDLQVTLGGVFARHVIVGSTLEVAINGSPEDRVLRNEYSVVWLAGYRFNRSTRIQSFAEYLVKRYPAPAAHSEFDPRVGIEFQVQLDARCSWELSGRYEENHADSSRYNYHGPTFESDLTLPLWPSARLESSGKTRVRNFSARLIKIGTGEVLRRDADFVATAAVHQAIGQWEIVFGYRYERFQSNDVRRPFVEHVALLTLNFWW